MKPFFLSSIFLSILCGTSEADDASFFDSKVLPILKQRCFECHSHGTKIKGGLALDSRSGWAEGGDNGPAIKPGQLEASLIIKAIRYVDAEFEMPPKAKLPASEIAILEEWVKLVLLTHEPLGPESKRKASTSPKAGSSGPSNP